MNKTANSFPTLLRVLSLALLMVATLAAGAEKSAPKDDEVDYLGLAGMLMRDGHHDRALAALEKVDPSDETVDRVRLYTLRGLARLHLGGHREAIADLHQARAEGQTDPMVHIYLAQAHYKLEQYQEVITAIRSAGELLKTLPSAWSMLAQSHWKLKQQGPAWEALAQAQALFPDNPGFLRQQVFYLIELKLYQEAAALGERYLAQAEAGPRDYLAIGSALRRSGQLEKAAAFLETARLRYPADPDVPVELAHVYLERGYLLSAADIFRQAAVYKPELMTEAAELYRRAGKLHRALYLNAGITDQSRKLKQRLAILLELENHEAAAAMEAPLELAGLMSNEDILYALAYARFLTGGLDQAEAHLTRISRTDLLRKSVELRKAIRGCRESWTACY